MVSGGVERAKGIEEEEAIGKKKKSKQEKKEEGGEERNREGWEVQALLFLFSF